MATDKNITMKQFNGTDYDTLYPKTIASQIPDVYSKSYIDSILKNNARIQTGSYVGTGTYGANNPCTLTFDFVPIFFIILGYKYDADNLFLYPWGKVPSGSGNSNTTFYDIFLTNEYKLYPVENTSSYVKRVDNTYFWYNKNGASGQLNLSDCTYYYLAIG